MVLAQKLRDLTLKRVEACKQLRDAYYNCLVEDDFDAQGRPLMQDARDKGIGYIILAEVQLEDPSNSAILVNLAILLEYTATIYSKYLLVKFAPFSGHDPLVWSELGDNINLQRALAFRRALLRYDKAQRI
ncbi:hypothetical protein IFM47457_05796 [Aspergillus lentulus]|nr:hypothetical protein IFM47457_05796 [Aspergillus lentulus]